MNLGLTLLWLRLCCAGLGVLTSIVLTPLLIRQRRRTNGLSTRAERNAVQMAPRAELLVLSAQLANLVWAVLASSLYRGPDPAWGLQACGAWIALSLGLRSISLYVSRGRAYRGLWSLDHKE